MAQGRVKWWNAEKGFGFLTVDGGGPDVFVHFSVLEMDGYRTLEDGQQVEFDIVQGQKGPQAQRVRPLKLGSPGAPTRAPAASQTRRPVPETSRISTPTPSAPRPATARPERGTDLMPSDPRIVGPYSISRRLGEGSMGIVYLAHDTANRQVALKVIREQFAQDTKFLRRFKSEAENARRVDASYTARVLDAAVDVDRPYLATEFIDGPTLADWVESHGPLTGSDAKAVGVGIAAALIAIHDAGIIHRDLKPSNVMLSYHGPRVIDFGIARSLASTTVLTNTGYPVGTPAYMSPEQLEMQDVTFASDIFSWGGVMTYATTGREPFPAEGHFAVMFSIVSKPASLDGVPSELRQLVADALHKDPSLRPKARDLLARLTGGRH